MGVFVTVMDKDKKAISDTVLAIGKIILAK
jgi:hypothetical protein